MLSLLFTVSHKKHLISLALPRALWLLGKHEREATVVLNVSASVTDRWGVCF